MSECIVNLKLRLARWYGLPVGGWRGLLAVSFNGKHKETICLSGKNKKQTNSSNNNEDNKNRNLNAFCCLGKIKIFCASLCVYTFMYIYIYIYGKTYIYTYIYITTLVFKEIERNVHKKDNENIEHVFSKERQSKKFYRW